MDHSVEEIEDLRLKELRKQAATFGPRTDPAILIEIQELSHRQRESKSTERRSFVNQLDYQFMMDVVAAALVRLGVVEASLSKNDRQRVFRQLIHDLWMIVITIICFANLLLILNQR